MIYTGDGVEHTERPKERYYGIVSEARPAGLGHDPRAGFEVSMFERGPTMTQIVERIRAAKRGKRSVGFIEQEEREFTPKDWFIAFFREPIVRDILENSQSERRMLDDFLTRHGLDSEVKLDALLKRVGQEYGEIVRMLDAGTTEVADFTLEDGYYEDLFKYEILNLPEALGVSSRLVPPEPYFSFSFEFKKLRKGFKKALALDSFSEEEKNEIKNFWAKITKNQVPLE